MTPAALIQHLRRASGLTQGELAQRLGRSQAAVAKLERPGANPTVETLEEALNALGYRLDLRAVRGSSGVDETLIARNLRMSPAERLTAFQTAHAEVAALRGLMAGRDAAAG
jgi:transcriptional regulator with XRE-family HTH domain